MSDTPGRGTREVLAAALRLLVRHRRAAYACSLAATLVNTVPDVGRKVLVWDDPSTTHFLLGGVAGVLTALLTQLWLTGALARLPDLTPSTALRRGTRIALVAVRAAPRTVLAGVLCGGAVSALLTLPASVAALGLRRMFGPLDAPGIAAFSVAAVSDVVASAVTLPFLSLVLVLAAAPRLDVAAAGSTQR